MLKIYRIVQYTPVKWFSDVLKSADVARRKRDEILYSSVVAEATKWLANSFSGWQIMDRSPHAVTKKLKDGMTHEAFNSKLFKRVDHTNDKF